MDASFNYLAIDYAQFEDSITKIKFGKRVFEFCESKLFKPRGLLLWRLRLIRLLHRSTWWFTCQDRIPNYTSMRASSWKFASTAPGTVMNNLATSAVIRFV